MKKLIIFESILIIFLVLSWNVSKADEEYRREHLSTLCARLVDTTIASNITKSANIYDELKRIQNLSPSEKQEKLSDIVTLGELSDKLTDQLYKYSIIYQNICVKTELRKMLDKLDIIRPEDIF